MKQAALPRRAVRAIPGSVWALGVVSMFMDTSSELVHSLLPVFMASTVGVGMAAIGLVEGIAEATGAITKVFAGGISDYLGKRKLLIVFGYGLSGLTKPVFPLATSIIGVAIPRFTDRIGKGIRGAPRDALVADITPPELRGAAYGLRQSLDTVGAFLGPLLALALMARFANDIRAVFWVAVVPALLAVVVLVVAVREPERAHHATGRRAPRFADAKRLSPGYWLIVAVGAAFTLARFSEAFLVLRARDVGLAMGYVPVVMIVMNVVYAAVAYPAGSPPIVWAAGRRSSQRCWRWLPPMWYWPGPAAPGMRSWGLVSGDCTWDSRRACWPSSWPTPRRRSSAARPLASSTSSPAACCCLRA